jgi:hypothetical protein
MTLPESAPHPASQSARARRRSARRRMLPKTAGERAAMLEALARRAYPTFEYFLFSLLCSAIIGAAYLLDAPALVLLAVLFAPLMTPWIGVTLATVTGSALFFIQAIGSFVIGGLIIFLTSTLSGFAARLWLPMKLDQAFLHSRLWWPDLIVLAVGAVVLALSFVRSEDRPFLPSVILAYEFYLPVASAGFGLGSGLPDLFPDGLLVFAIHFAWATLFGVLTLALMGFRPATFAGFTLGTTLVLAGVMLLLGLSGLGAVIQTRLGLTPPTATPPSIPLPPRTATPTPTQTTLVNTSSSLEPATEAEVDQAEISLSEFGAAAKAVDLIAAWVEAGAPETEAFNYTGIDGNTYPATFEVDILPLFTENGLWFEGAQACAGCHFGNTEASYHEMSLASYDGLMKGGDVLSSPPGAPILGQSKVGATDFNFDASRLRTRLRNNRMPPGWPFDITETNRNGPCVQVSAQGVTLALDADGKITYGCELNAVGVIEAWVNAGAPENQPFEYGGEDLTFARDVQPFFTQPNMWFEGSQACSGCHFGNTENSYHEMDLSTYEGMLKGGDVLSSPPGVPILGQSQVGATDFDFEHSKLRERLRNNRMPPGVEFDITEENRDGPIVLAGVKK